MSQQVIKTKNTIIEEDINNELGKFETLGDYCKSKCIVPSRYLWFGYKKGRERPTGMRPASSLKGIIRMEVASVHIGG